MSPCLAVQMSLQSKIEVMQGKLIFGSHAEHTAAYHQTNSSRYRSVHKQEFIRINGNVIKTALMNTSTELNKIFQDTPTKQQDPKLKHSVVMIEYFFFPIPELVCPFFVQIAQMGLITTHYPCSLLSRHTPFLGYLHYPCTPFC